MIDGDCLPTLVAERLRLRALADGDVDALFRVFSDPDVMHYWSTTAFVDRAAAEALLAQIRAGFARRDLFQWGIARRSDDTVIGTCTMYNLVAAHRRAEIGFALGREHWGRGYAAEALTRLLEFAFDELGLHRLEADTDPRNARSIRLLEQLGFQREGHLRERWYVGGEALDGLFYGLLAPDWRRNAVFDRR